MTESTARFALPLIAAGQAQKDVIHNEALAALDLIAQTAVSGVGVDTPPASPTIGACWIVGAAPTGAWSGHARTVAGWTEGGWRFVAPREGMMAWTGGANGFARFVGGTWVVGGLTGATLTLGGLQVVGARRPAIADAAGGTVVDGEARAGLNAVLATLRTHGLIAN